MTVEDAEPELEIVELERTESNEDKIKKLIEKTQVLIDRTKEKKRIAKVA